MDDRDYKLPISFLPILVEGLDTVITDFTTANYTDPARIDLQGTFFATPRCALV
jgi:hypothetical protein